jgi:hypothetical protein
LEIEAQNVRGEGSWRSDEAPKAETSNPFSRYGRSEARRMDGGECMRIWIDWMSYLKEGALSLDNFHSASFKNVLSILLNHFCQIFHFN